MAQMVHPSHALLVARHQVLKLYLSVFIGELSCSEERCCTAYLP